MPCAACGRWAREYRWYSEMRFEWPDQTPSGPDPHWHCWYQDAANPRLYWILKCAPTCAGNELLDKIDDAQEALLSQVRFQLHVQLQSRSPHVREHGPNRPADALARLGLQLVRQFRELRLVAKNSLDELSEAWLVLES